MERRPRFQTSREVQQRLLARFLEVLDGGGLDDLTELLAEEVTLWSDGGGKARALRKQWPE